MGMFALVSLILAVIDHSAGVLRGSGHDVLVQLVAESLRDVLAT